MLRPVRFCFLLSILTGFPPTTHSIAQEATPPHHARSLIDDLRAPNVELRRTAAAQLRTAGREVQRQALPVLIDHLLKEKDGQVRLAVLDTVTMLGPDARSAVPALVHTLHTNYGGQGKEESHQDYRSALALAAIGQPAVEGLRGVLKERKESVRAEAVMGLGRIGPDAAAAIPDLIPFLGDPSERLRREAALALGRIGPSAIDLLIAAAASPDVTTRASALESLGHLAAPDDRVNKTVLERTHDGAPEVRAAALGSLARLNVSDDRLLPILTQSLRHPDEQTHRGVVNLLVDRRALLSRLAPELASLLTAEDDGTARYAAYLLRQLGPDGAPLLLKALPHPASRIDQIADALAQIGRPVALLLTQAVEAADPRVRRGAALALGQIRPPVPGAVPKLTVGLADPSSDVKAAFLTAIGALGARASEAVPPVRTLLQDPSADLRLQAIDILAHAAPRDDQLLADLSALLDDPDARVRRQVIDTIRSLGPLGRKAIPRVIAKLGNTDPEVRLAAAEMVASHGQAAVDAVPALGALLADPTPKIRTIAALTLGKLGKAAQPEFSRLTPLLADEQADVREAAVLTMGSLDLDPEVIRPHLARALRDANSEVRRAATRAIQRLGPQGVIFVPDIILLSASKENLRSVDRLLRPFERTGPDVRSLPELIKQLDHDQLPVRLLAIKFLGLAGPSAREAIPALERIGEDPSAEVRRQAKAACEQIRQTPSSPQQPSAAQNEGATHS